MAEAKTIRINKVLREFNISLDRAVEFLGSKGHVVEARPTSKISETEYQVLFAEFQTDKSKKVEAKEVGEEKRKEKEELRIEREKEEVERLAVPIVVVKAEKKLDGPKMLGKIDLSPKKESKPVVTEKAPVVEVVEEKIAEVIEIETPKAEAPQEDAPVVVAAPADVVTEAPQEAPQEIPQ